MKKCRICLDKLEARSEEQLHTDFTERIEKLMKETVDNKKKIEIMETEATAKEETIKKQEKKLKETIKETEELENKLKVS